MLDRYRSHLLLTAYTARLDAGTGELATSELAAFITGQALITVRQDDGVDIGAVIQRWDESPDLARFGVGYLLYGLLDYIVDSQFEAVRSLDGFYGMNVPYPGFGQKAGLAASIAVIVLAALVLYVIFKRKDWL